jgi:hypothetical protein
MSVLALKQSAVPTSRVQPAHRAPLEHLSKPASGSLLVRLVPVHRLTIDPAAPVATH